VAEFFSKAVEFGEKDFLEAYPRIKELVDRVQNEPAIKKVLTIINCLELGLEKRDKK